MATLLSIRQTIARRIGKYQSGAVTGGDTITIIDVNNRYEGDDELKEDWVEFLTQVSGSANVSTVRKIDGNTRDNMSFTCFPTLSAAVASGDTYGIYGAPWKPSDYVDFINESLQEDYPFISRLRADESITVEANTFAYTCPSGMDDIRQVWFQEDLGTASFPYTELDHSLWEVTEEVGTKTLRLKVANLTNRTLRLIGTGRFFDLSANTDTIELEGEDLELLYYGVMYRMWEQLEANDVGNTERYTLLANRARARYNDLKRKHTRRLPAGRAKTPTYDGGWQNT